VHSVGRRLKLKHLSQPLVGTEGLVETVKTTECIHADARMHFLVYVAKGSKWPWLLLLS